MIHKPIQLQDISLIYPHKTCFEAFSSCIYFGDRIAIIGRNGVGKSTLLKMLQGAPTSIDGEIKKPRDIRVGYLPQIIDDFPELSGGQRLNQHLTILLAANPNLLLLDEPTNHLDSCNRRSLIRMLQHYLGTLIIVSHDIELIDATADILWHIDAQSIRVFSGCYHDYQREPRQKEEWIEQELENLSKQKKEVHRRLMKEQERNKQLRIRGEKHIAQRKWPTIRSHAKLASSVKTGA
jgi:ATPase subunit of ABC transporter with duplicated ATPase domains